MQPNVQIQEVARRLGGVASREELDKAGISLTSVDQEVRVGRLRVVHPGVYVPAAVDLDHERRLRAALRAVGPDGALSHRSAAHRLEAGSHWSEVVEVVVPHHARPRLKGVTVRRTTWLPAAHVRQVGGLPTTTIDRTLADLGAVVSRAAVDEALQKAVIGRRTTIERLLAFIDQYGRQGRTGIATLRACLEDWLLGDKPPDSALEVAFARLVRRAGLPRPAYQHEIRVAGTFIARVDAAWPSAKVVVEVDGLHSHSSAAALQRDHDRQNDLVGLGWAVLRFTWRDVVQRPATVAARIRPHLDARPTPLVP